MTIYIPTNDAGDWKMARSRQTIAGVSDNVGNLSFQTNSRNNEKVHSSSRGVERYGVSVARGSLPVSTASWQESGGKLKILTDLNQENEDLCLQTRYLSTNRD
tara:strand:+ start:1006 stop:1314 length:309 start_codon:yes stop_codon:yes gene_type:complete